MILSIILGALVKGIGRLLFRLRISGLESIPQKGGGLLVANHTSYIDFVLMVAMCPRSVHFIMNEDVFKKPLLRPLLKALNCIPIGPRGHRNDLAAFNQAVVDQVNAGHLVAIFAEGTVTRTGQILEFKKGVEHLSKLIDGPVIPIHFDNVAGSPFSYRAGRQDMVRMRLKAFRRRIFIQVGTPIHGGISAFHLRQRIKELEVINFERRLQLLGSVQKRLSKLLSQTLQGAWIWDDRTIEFSQLSSRLSMLNRVLSQSLKNEQRVAVLLPNSALKFEIYLWLTLQRKTIVPILEEWTNEERLYAMNQSNTRLLITTNDLDYTRYAPTAEGIIFVQDIEKGLREDHAVEMVCDRLKWARRKVISIFTTKKKEEPLAIFFENISREEKRLIPIYQEQFLSVITSLRQVYHFEKGTTICSNIGLNHSFGWVLELLLPLCTDMRVDMRERATEKQLRKQLSETKPSIFVATPTQMRILASATSRLNFPFLTHVFTADVDPNHEAVCALSARGIMVMTCAGMNATTSVFAVNLHNYEGRDIVGKVLIQEAFDADSIGKALPGVAVKVVLPNDHSVEMNAGEEGLLLLKGASISPVRCGMVMQEHQAWMSTGWSGYIDSKGFIHILSREAKRMEKREAC